jgi:hypothetical protein
MSNPVDRVAAAAQNVRLLKIVLSVAAFPFWLLGLAAGVVVTGVVWCIAAVQVGYSDVRKTDGSADAGTS